MAGGFQRPRVDPGCLNAPEQEGCNVSLGSEVFYPSELELQTVPSQLWVPCTPHELLSSPVLMTKQAQHTLLSAAPLEQQRQRHHPVQWKWSQTAWLVPKFHLKSIPFSQWGQPRPLRGCSMLHSASARGWIAGESFFILSTVKPSPSLKLCSLLSLFYCSN